MDRMRFRHHNNCSRCPAAGAEDIPGEEFFQLRALRFNLQIARMFCRLRTLHRVDPAGLAQWLEHVVIDEEHLGHLPRDLGPGIMVTLPPQWGKPLIDGNHRATRALREGTEFLTYVLSETETLELLRRSMGRAAADHYWARLMFVQPGPEDLQEGEKP